eukprot:4751496-Amphidinium_carterae.1
MQGRLAVTVPGVQRHLRHNWLVPGSKIGVFRKPMAPSSATSRSPALLPLGRLQKNPPRERGPSQSPHTAMT